MLRPTQEDTRDSAQESLTRLLRYRDTEPASAWRPLLYRIARNLLNEQWRRARSHREQYNVPVDLVELPDRAPPPALYIKQAQQPAWLRPATLSLPHPSRLVFLPVRIRPDELRGGKGGGGHERFRW